MPVQKTSFASISPNPFNPGSPVDPNDFVGRTSELENFRHKLEQTAGGSLASMAVSGGYGVGKTSFLHKCKVIAEEMNALTVYLSLNEMPKYDRETLSRVLIERTADKVREEVILQKISKKVWDVLRVIRLKAGPNVELRLGNLPEAEHPNLQSALKAAWKALKGDKTAIVFLIDEAGVLEKNRAELVLYLRAVLEQLQTERIPVMMVPAGKLSITGPSGTGFSPLVRTFPPAILENFSKSESRAFIDKKLSRTGMNISDAAFEKVCIVTEGHPFVLNAYLNSAYSRLSPKEKELTEVHLRAADIDFVGSVLGRFFARFYDDSGKVSQSILDILASSKNGEAFLSELSDKLKKDNNELSPYIGKLVQDGAVIRIDRGKYRLFHHLLGEYIQLKKTEFY
ncbi:MAG: ATP-binding protein [Candidatus Micrarchaeia archaeon]|jgi:hypothetical protein